VAQGPDAPGVGHVRGVWCACAEVLRCRRTGV
jgi:hypothetical protein